MNEEKINKLYESLKEFATLPCDFDEKEFNCKKCPIGYYCSALYTVSRAIKGEIKHDKMIDILNVEYKNIKWLEGDDNNE